MSVKTQRPFKINSKLDGQVTAKKCGIVFENFNGYGINKNKCNTKRIIKQRSIKANQRKDYLFGQKYSTKESQNFKSDDDTNKLG